MPLYLYIAGLFALSSIPSGSIPDVEAIFAVDKLIHFVEYGILSFLMFRAMFSSGRLSVKWITILVIFCAAALGAIDESYQSLTGRNRDLHDWIADILGATLVSIGCLILYQRVQEALKAKRGGNFRG